MPKSWKEIYDSDLYKDAPYDEKVAVREDYFKVRIMPQVRKFGDDPEVVREDFYSKYPVEVDWTGEVGIRGETIPSEIASKDWTGEYGSVAERVEREERYERYRQEYGLEEVKKPGRWFKGRTGTVLNYDDPKGRAEIEKRMKAGEKFAPAKPPTEIIDRGTWEEQFAKARQIKDPKKRQELITKFEEVESSILEDPVVAATMGAFVRGAAFAGRGAKKIATEAVKGAAGEVTYGATDILGVGAKGVKKGVKKVAAKAKTQEEILRESEEFIDNLMRHLNKPIPSAKDTQKIVKPQDIIKPVKKTPKYAGSINLHRQQISDMAKQMELDTFAKEGATIKISNKETIAKAEKILNKFKTNPEYLAERVASIKSGQTPSMDEYLAHRMMNATNQENLISAMKKTAAGELSIDEFRALENEVKDMQLNVINPVATDFGRNLQSLNIMVGRDKAFKAAAKLNKNLNERQMKEFIELSESGFKDPHKVQEFVERLPDPKIKDYLYEYWYNSILSGIPTHVVNTVSNTLWLSWQVPHRALTAGVDKVISTLSGRQRKYFMSEIVPMMAGVPPGFKKGKDAFKEMIKTGRIEGIRTKFNRDIGNAIMSAFERSPNKNLRKLAPVVSGPTRALSGMDVWHNSIAYDMQYRALAKRISIQTGQDELKLLKKPTQEMMEEASEFARYATFQDMPGAFTKGMMKLRESFPGGRLIVPFVNTIANLTKRGIEMTPGIGLTLARGQDPAEIIAKQIEGSVITLLLANKLTNGEITGAAPTDKAERDAFYRQGKLPWAIRVGGEIDENGQMKGGTWIQYRRIEPFNTVIASVSEFYNNFAKNPDDKTITEQFSNASKGVAMNLIDSSYMQGVQQILNRYGKIEGTVQRQLSSLVPFSSFWRSINRSVEAIVEGNAKLRETKDFLGAASQVLPGFYWLKEPKLDVWGEDILIEGNFFRQWLPYKWTTETEDKVELTLEQLGYYPGLPSKKIKLRDRTIELSDTEYRDYVKKLGKMGKEAIKDIIDNPNFETLDDEYKLKFIDRRLNMIRRNVLKEVKFRSE